LHEEQAQSLAVSTKGREEAIVVGNKQGPALSYRALKVPHWRVVARYNVNDNIMKTLHTGLVLSTFGLIGGQLACASIDYTNDSGYRQIVSVDTTINPNSNESEIEFSSFAVPLNNGDHLVVDDTTEIIEDESIDVSYSLGSIETLVGRSIAFQASNGQYLCADRGGGAGIVANRDGVGAWERFVFQDGQGGDIISGGVGFLRSDQGQFLCAEGGGGSTLNATRSAGSTWEEFTIWKIDDDGNVVPGVINSGDRIVVTTFDGHYWCANLGGGGDVVANRTGVGEWERFTITIY
jgi:hypothetical protein